MAIVVEPTPPRQSTASPMLPFAAFIDSTPPLTLRQRLLVGGPRRDDGQEFAWIAVDGHSWFSLSSVEIHLWVRQRGTKMDLNHSNGDGYASGVRYFA